MCARHRPTIWNFATCFRSPCKPPAPFSEPAVLPVVPESSPVTRQYPHLTFSGVPRPRHDGDATFSHTTQWYLYQHLSSVPEPPKPAPKPAYLNPTLSPVLLTPAPTTPTALAVSHPSQVSLPSPPACFPGVQKKKRETPAQRVLCRTFERTPRGAQVKVLGAHVAMRIMIEVEEEAAFDVTVVMVNEQEEDDVCMSDS